MLGSRLTVAKVAAAEQFIENHYKTNMKNIQEHKERYVFELKANTRCHVMISGPNYLEMEQMMFLV